MSRLLTKPLRRTRIVDEAAPLCYTGAIEYSTENRDDVRTMIRVLQEERDKRGKGPREIQLARALESFGEFFRERAGRALRTTLLRTLVLFSASLAAWRSSA